MGNVGIINLYKKVSALSAAFLITLSSSLAAMPLFLTQKATALPGADVVINEVSALGSEWIELYNTTNSPIDISDWRIHDSVGSVNFGNLIPGGTIIAAHGYYVHPQAATAIFNDSGDSVKLLDNSSVLVDALNYPALSGGQTYGRSSGNNTQLRSVGILASSTQGTANPSFSHTQAYNQTQQLWYDTLTNAVTLAFPGDTIQVHGVHTITSNISIGKQLVIRGISGASIQTSGNAQLLTITGGGAGTTIKDIAFTKTDNVNQSFIGVQANNVSILNNSFTGQWHIGDSQTVRGLIVSPGRTGYNIRNNDFVQLRQPAYIDGVSSGTVVNNYTDGTKGWVVESDADINFNGNTWGTNVLDIALIPGSTNAYPDSRVVQISNRNNDAVVENQFGGTKLLSDAYVQPAANGNVGDEGSKWNPYTSIQNGMSRIVEGGTIHVADGVYNEKLAVLKNGTKLVGESRGGTVVQPHTNGGYGITVHDLNNVSIENMSFKVPAGKSLSYNLHAYRANGVDITNVTFDGQNNTSGGADFNSSRNITLDNVTAKDYSKNGFAFTSRYETSDPISRNISFNDVTAESNNWAGIAFYTVGNDHSPSSIGGTGNITGVTFTGTNTILNNTKGLEIVGDSDANASSNNDPRYFVSGPSNAPLNLGAANFSGNNLDILNYQAKDITATAVLFSGKTGNNMTSAERQAENQLIVDQKDSANLGLVQYYDAPTVPTNGLPNNAYEPTNDFDFTWDASSGDGTITYEFQSSQNPATDGNGVLTTGLWQSGVLSAPTIHSSGAPDGSWYWQVRAIDGAGNKSAWSQVWVVTLDTQAPTTPTITTPTNDQYFNATPILNQWSVATDSVSGVKEYEIKYIYDDHHEVGGSDVIIRTVTGTSRNHVPNISEQGGVTIWVRAIDNLGHASAWSAPVHYYYDATPPEVSVDPLPNGGLINGSTVAINGTVDDDNFSEYRYQLLDENKQNTLGNSIIGGHNPVIDGQLGAVDVSTLPDGNYFIRVWAKDKAGNQTGTKNPPHTVSFTLDNTEPAVTVNTLDTTDTTPELSGTVDDPSATVEVTVGSNTYVATVSGNTWSAQITDTLTPGSYDVAVTATDQAGNVGTDSTSDELTITVQNVGGQGGDGNQPLIVTTSANTPITPQNNLGTNQLNNTNAQVLGANTTNNTATTPGTDDEDGEVKAATTETTKDGDKVENTSNTWLYWALAAIVIGALGYLAYRNNKLSNKVK